MRQIKRAGPHLSSLRRTHDQPVPCCESAHQARFWCLSRQVRSAASTCLGRRRGVTPASPSPALRGLTATCPGRPVRHALLGLSSIWFRPAWADLRQIRGMLFSRTSFKIVSTSAWRLVRLFHLRPSHLWLSVLFILLPCVAGPCGASLPFLSLSPMNK